MIRRTHLVVDSLNLFGHRGHSSAGPPSHSPHLRLSSSALLFALALETQNASAAL